MPRGNAAALNTPESREKRKATIKESVRRRKAIKAVESLGNLDLAPIDEQINDLEKQIARLKNAKKIILQLRGETPAAIEPGKPVNGVSLLHRSKTCRPWTRSMPASRAHRPWVPTRSPPSSPFRNTPPWASSATIARDSWRPSRAGRP